MKSTEVALVPYCERISVPVTIISHLHFSSFAPEWTSAENGLIWDTPAEKQQADPQLHGAGFGDQGRALFH